MVRDGYTTEDQAMAALHDPLPLGNGSALPPIQAEIVAPNTSFARVPLVAGLTLLVVGLASFIIARRIQSPIAFALTAVVGIVAITLIARSVKVA